MSVVNIRHLRAFAAVAEHNHFTKAADAIHLSQPALSVLIKQLEDALNVKLIHRRTRNVELTPIGREFYGVSQKVLASFDEALVHVSDYSALRKGKVTLAALPSLSASILPQLLNSFAAKHPNISLNIMDAPGEEILEAVRARRADLALTYTKPSAEFAVTPVIRDKLVLIGTPKRARAKGGAIRWSSLGGEPIIAMAAGTTIRALTDAAASTAKTPLHIVLEPRLIPTAVAFAEAGFGCAVLPSSHLTFRQSANAPKYDLVGPSIEREISLLHLSQYPLSPAAEALFKFLRQKLERRSAAAPAKRAARS